MLLVQPQLESKKTSVPHDTADGSPNEMPVFIARPAGPIIRRPAVIVIQEAMGVNNYIMDVCCRYAAQGFVALSPDLYFRNGPWKTAPYGDMTSVRPLMQAMKEEETKGDLKAALDFLTAQPDVDPSRIGITGFCMGGRVTFHTAAQFPGRIKAGAAYYGGRADLNLLKEIKCPIIAFYGQKDGHIGRDQVETISKLLTEAGVNRGVYYYPDADHGFFCNERDKFHPVVSQDAWCRTQEFFHRYLGPVPPCPWSG